MYSIQETNNKSSSMFNCFDLLLILINLLAYVAMVFFNIASTFPMDGLFDHKPSDIAYDNRVDITPNSWTFVTWAISYVWIGLWILLNIAFVFIRSDYGPLYKQPPVFTRQLQLFICANFLLNTAWVFLWDAQHFTVHKRYIIVSR